MLTKADYCVASHHLRLDQKVVLKPTTTAKTTAKSQLACIICTWVRRNNSTYQQVAVISIKAANGGLTSAKDVEQKQG